MALRETKRWRSFGGDTIVFEHDSSIYFNGSIDGGETWLSRDVRVDKDVPNGGLAVTPQLECDGARVYALWADRRDGNWDLYLARNPQ